CKQQQQQEKNDDEEPNNKCTVDRIHPLNDDVKLFNGFVFNTMKTGNWIDDSSSGSYQNNDNDDHDHYCFGLPSSTVDFN
ncbi:hypothetical protein DERF_011144, partial [Dermatophagoides farinae]